MTALPVELRDNWTPPSLPAQTPPETRTRAADPSTSLVAAATVDMRAQYIAILSRLTDGQPRTYHDLIPANSAGRVTELHRAKMIESVGLSTTPGKRGRLWRITDAGRAALS